MGAVMCLEARQGDAIETLWPAFREQPIRALITNPRLSGRTTSLGRLFDAAAAILGLVETVRDDAYAAVMLESAGFNREGHVVGDAWRIEGGILDFTPLFSHLIRGRLSPTFDARQTAADFEATVAAGLAHWAASLIPDPTVPVCLAGGVFLNRTISRDVPTLLARRGFTCYLPQKLPPGDGAVSFGQIVVTRQRLMNQGGLPCV